MVTSMMVLEIREAYGQSTQNQIKTQNISPVSPIH
jgi:hypothetical protein